MNQVPKRPFVAVRRPAALWGRLGVTLLAAAATATLGQAPAEAPSNRVLEFDEGAYVELPVAAFESLEEATVEAWVRWDEWSFYSQWFAYGTDELFRSLGINHWSISPILQFFIYPGQPEDLRVIRVQTALSLGEWHHMATVSGAGGMRFYIDGALMGTDPHPGSFADLGVGTQAFLGRSTWAANAGFRGALDEVRLWSVARSVDQIRADMGRALQGDETGLAGLWNCDEGDARDGSGHGFDGVLRDGARCEEADYPGAAPRVWPGVLRGEIRDENGAPVLARVRLTSQSGITLEAGSDHSGVFSLAIFDTGRYDVEVIGGGVRMPRRELSVTPGADLWLDLRAPPPHLVARWSAEGDARDRIGEFHGDLSGDVTFAPGVVGQAFRFGGEDAGAGYVRVPNAAELNPKGNFSLVAWVLPETDRIMALLSLWGDYGGWYAQRAYSLGALPGGRLTFRIADSLHQEDPAYHEFLTRPSVLPLHAWSLVVGVWDASSGERRLYANGLLVGRRVDVPGSVSRSRADLGIGIHLHHPTVTTAPFAGRIDEVALYGVDLSEEEISRLYSAHAQAKWPAEGNANDVTRSGHDGVAVGGDVTFMSGVVGQAFGFDGSTGRVEFDQRIGNYGSEDFSVELWLCPASGADSEGPILVKGDAGATLNLSFDGAGHVAATLADGLASLRLVSGQPLAAETWHHVVLVREGRQTGLYVDGELDTSAATQHTVDLQTASPLQLGGTSETPSFSGLIDEVALHRQPLSAEEIRATYDRVETQWRWNVWRAHLQTWGVVAFGLLAVATGGRYVTQRRARRRHEEQLAEAQRARQAADDASAAKSAFLAHVSHEIRTPLNAMLGHAQVLRDKPSMADEDRRGLTSICDHGGHLLQLLNDVLDLSRVEAGRVELKLSDVDLGTLVAGLASLFEARCRQKDLQFRLETDADLGWVRTDAGKLRQVLVNLLGNAVKFTDDGEVVLRVSRTGDDHLFEVRDTGPGIAPETQDSIFQPFEQGPEGLAAGGSGLGLAIARRHVEIMGGRLEVESSPGGGSRFAFGLTLKATARPTRDCGTAASESEPAAVETFDGLALPANLRQRLHEAAQMHNLTEVKLCLEQLQELGDDEARLAATLFRAVRSFDLRPVQRALEGTVDD